MSIETTRRVIFYSHDAQGLGHVRRNLALAHRIVEDNSDYAAFSGLLISGLQASFDFPLPPGFDWLTLPGVSKGDHGYQPRHLGSSMDSLVELRGAILETTLTSAAPDLVVIDRHAYGVLGELRQPLETLRTLYPETKIVLGLREVLDSPEVAAREWERLGDLDEFCRIFDEIWCYGDAQVHDPLATGEIPAPLASKVRMLGYLSEGRRADVSSMPPEHPFVLTTAGGGSDGEALFHTAAEMEVPRGHEHIIVTGPQLEHEQVKELQLSAGERTSVVRTIPGLSMFINAAAAVLTMGGYNTVNEIMATSTPALIVPREVPRKEQLIRAQGLSRHGAMEYITADHLSPGVLSSWVGRAVERTVDRSWIRRDGLTQAAARAAELLNLPTSQSTISSQQQVTV